MASKGLEERYSAFRKTWKEFKPLLAGLDPTSTPIQKPLQSREALEVHFEKMSLHLEILLKHLVVLKKFFSEKQKAREYVLVRNAFDQNKNAFKALRKSLPKALFSKKAGERGSEFARSKRLLEELKTGHLAFEYDAANSLRVLHLK